MIKRKKIKIEAKAGDIIKIPLPDGSHTYARILIEGSYAIYDCKTTVDIDLASVIQKPILFIGRVNVFALEDGIWTIIGNIPLEEGLDTFYPRYFMPAPTNEVNINFYNVYKDEIEMAITKDWIVGSEKTQIGGMHSHVTIEKRVMDYYEGKRNVDNRNTIQVFKRYLGLPIENI